MDSTVAPRAASPIIVPGQLTLRTIRGRNGPFTVGRLTTHLGVFEVKDAELEQYPEGKYDGEFVIRYIYPKAYPTGGGMRFEIRANLDGMTLSGIDKLSRDEARGFASQDVDPLDGEASRREGWIAEQLDRGINVLITNSELVKTGLDLLEFPTIVLLQSGYHLYSLQQAERRSWRIGQKQPVKVIYLGSRPPRR